MKTRKAVVPDGILIEVWKCISKDEVRWLTKLFNKICKIIRCLMNRGRVHWCHYIKTKVTLKTAQIIEE